MGGILSQNNRKSVCNGAHLPDTLCKGGSLQEHKLEIYQLIADSVAGMLAQPTLLQLEGSVMIAGDIHGHLQDLEQVLAGWSPADQTLLFLGDYVDRGAHSLQVFFRLLYLRREHPGKLFMLRGNHEAFIGKNGRLWKECLAVSKELPKLLQQVFDVMPLAAVIQGKYYCAHGGIGPNLHDLLQIDAIARPIRIPITGLICDLIWSDPGHKSGFPLNIDRGCSVVYGKREAEQFLKTNRLKMIIRAHRVCMSGAEYELDGLVLTVYSSTDPHYQNQRAVVLISTDGEHAVRKIPLQTQMDEVELTAIGAEMNK